MAPEYTTIVIKPGSQVLDPVKGGWWPVPLRLRVRDAIKVSDHFYRFRDQKSGRMLYVRVEYIENRT